MVAVNKKMPSQRVGKAKPSRKLLQQFAMKQLNINPSTLKVLLAISPYVDIDGQVVVAMDKIRRTLNMQKKTFNLVLTEAKYNHLLVYKDGSYYSNFHVQATGEPGEMSYIKIFDVFTSPSFLGYSLNEQRLFSFILTRSIKPTQWQTYNIVQLYINNRNSINKGLSIFPTFRELGNALISLIKNDHIEVKLLSTNSEGKSFILNSTSKAIEKTFFAFFGKSEKHDNKVEKYSRFSLEDIDSQLIRIRVSPSVANKERTVIASEYELDKIARENFFMAADISPEQKGYIIGYKNELFQLAGETGIKIYRKCLKEFIEDHGVSILTFSENQKAANYFMNFYILKEIQNILNGVALHQNILKDTNSRFNELLSHGYIIPTNLIGSLLNFFMKYGSSSHILRLDRALFEHGINYSSFTLHKTGWELLKVKRDTILISHENVLGDLFDNSADFEDYIFDCALTGTLLNIEDVKEHLSQDDEKVLQKARFDLTKMKIRSLREKVTEGLYPAPDGNDSDDVGHTNSYKELFDHMVTGDKQ